MYCSSSEMYFACHHRPYEGQQREHDPVPRVEGGSHHRPYEGQQP